VRCNSAPEPARGGIATFLARYAGEGLRAAVQMTDWRSLRWAPAAGTRLCGAQEVTDGQGKEIVFGAGKDAFRVVVLRLGDRLFAFHNCCPHFSLPLNYEPDRFHVFDGDLLMCAHHTAIYRIADGACIDGPCQGARLTSIALQHDAGSVYIAAAPAVDPLPQ
jgi:nitrite reductase/ring-hydroxylating ferredoxin subunit